MGPTAPAKPQLPAAQRNGPAAAASSAAVRIDGAVVIRAGADHTFHVPAPRGAIAKIDIVDVDLVLTGKDGRRIILEGGAVGAFSDADARVAFTDAPSTLTALVDEVGQVKVDEQPFIAQSSPLQQDSASNQTKNEDGSDVGVSKVPPAPTPPPAVGPGQSAADHPPVFYVSNIVYASPPAHQLPQSPTFNESTQILTALEARTGQSLVNGVLTGAYGATGADTNPSAAAQMTPETLKSIAPGMTVVANALGGASFIKVLHLSYVGAGNVASITLSGLGAGFTIIGAAPDATGTYHLSTTAFASAQGANQFDIPVEYDLHTPDAASPVHQSFETSVTLAVTGQATASYQKTLSFVVTDAVTAADITTATTGSNVLVFPAQGIGYVFAAAGEDTITGGCNNDTVYGGGGGNALDGAAGTNTLDYSRSSSAETINAAAGVALGAGGEDTIANFQRLVGAAANSLIIGAKSTVFETSGSDQSQDTFESGGGGTAAAPETIAGGGSGRNTLSYADAAGPVTVNLVSGVATGFGQQSISNVQLVVGSAYDDTLTGAASTLSLAAGGPTANVTFDPGGGGTGSGLESIVGSALGVNLVTYANATTGVTVNLTTGLASGAGLQVLSNIEEIQGSPYADNLTGSSTTVKLLGGGGADTFDGGGGGTLAAPETITGGDSGHNELTFVNAPGGVTVNLQAGVAFGSAVSGEGYGYESIANIQYVVGSAYADSLTGTVTTRVLSGGTGGDDTFDGGGGGSAAAPETIAGSASGVNTASYASSGVGVTVNLSPGPGQDGVETGYGVQDLANIQIVLGSAYADSLRGGPSTLALNGGAGGEDTFDGGGGGTAAAPETITGSPVGPNTLTFARDASGGVVANLQTGIIDANAYGEEKVSSIQILIGSALGNDSLTGARSTLALEAGSITANDTFDGGGGGVAAAPETILGGAAGTTNTLTFAADLGGRINANLATGVVDAGGAAGYGYLQVSGLQRLVGSAGGGDTLVGAPGVLYISSPSTIAGDTFDGGGGGSQAAPESLVGTAGVVNTLTFSADTLAGAAGAVVVNLTPLVGSFGEVTGADGFQLVTNITRVVGSAFGDDTIIGAPGGSDLIAGAGNVVLQASGGASTLLGGGGHDQLEGAVGRNLIILGSGPSTVVGGTALNGANADTLSFANAAQGVSVDLGHGTAVGDGPVTVKGLIAGVVGSAFNDLLIGTGSTRSLTAGGALSNDTFDGGGGGFAGAAETIAGSQYGLNTLTFAADTIAPVSVNLATGVADGGGQAGYGYEQVSNISDLVGSAIGGDTLRGASTTLVIDGSKAAAADTFDGGGGGTQARPEVITGAAGLANALTFAGDTATGALGAVYVNLESGVMRSGGYGYEALANITAVTGSAYGSDTLVGGSSASDLFAGGGAVYLQSGAGGGVLAAGSGSDTVDAVLGRNDIILGGGAVTVIGSGLVTTANADTLDFSKATGGVRVNLAGLTASGYGPVSLSGVFAGLIGSDNAGDSLTGSAATSYISGGGGVDGIIDPGGGGSAAAPETVVGGSGGLYALSFAGDSVASVNANLSSGTTGSGGAGVVSAGGPGGYGVDAVSGFAALVGSAKGGDVLTGGPGVVLVTAGQATVQGFVFTQAAQVYGDTFDGGGGGSAAAPEYLIGAPGVVNALTFATDTGAGAAGAVYVNLSSDTAPGGYGNVLVGSAVELVRNITTVFGSALGQDTLIGDGGGDMIRAGGGPTSISEILGANPAAVNTLVGGAGGGTIDASVGRNMVYAGPGALNIFMGVANDTLAFNDSLSAPGAGGVVVNLAQGLATIRGTGAVDTLTASGTNAGFAALIGSAGNDLLIGSASTQSIAAGASTSNDTIAPGGGGSPGAFETIVGGAAGVNTLTYAADTLSSVSARLGAGSVAGSVTSSAYGDQAVTYIEKLTGSAYGGDTLQGASTTLVLQSGSTLRGDTFNPGGGGSAATPETIVGSAGALTNTLTAAGDTVHAVSVNLVAGVMNGTDSSGGAGYGYAVLTNIQAVVGSDKGGDLLIGAPTTLALSAGLGGNDTFVAGGGGSLSTPETIHGGGSGVFLLDYSADTVASLTASLATGVVTSAAYAYGVQAVTGVTELYGSAKGGDSLTGAASTVLIAAMGPSDTIDGGGGGNAAVFETISGSTVHGALTTLSFAGDHVHGVIVNLAAGSVNGGGSAASGGYGYETVSGVTGVIGSAAGGDSLIGSSLTQSLVAGSGAGDTFVAGGGGSLLAPETIRGAATGINVLSYAADTFGAIQANLAAGAVNTTGYGYQSVSAINELIGSAVGGDVLTGTATTLLLQASSTASVGDTFFGGGGTLAAPETITGASGGVNELSLGQDGAYAAQINLSASTISAGLYGVEQYSKIQEIVGSGAGGDLFTVGATLAVNGVQTLVGALAGTDTLSFAADTQPAGGVKIDLLAGSVSGALALASVSNIVNVIGSAAGADTFVTGGAIAGNGTPTYAFQEGAGADQITTTVTQSTTDITVSASGGSAAITTAANVTDVLSLAALPSAETLRVGAAGETLSGGLYAATVSGGVLTSVIGPTVAGANNAADFSALAAGAVNVSLATGVVSGALQTTLTGFDQLTGSALGADTLAGGPVNDTLVGGGGAGVQIITGSAQNLVIAGAGSESVTAGNGSFNTLSFQHDTLAGSLVVNLHGLSGGGSGTASVGAATDTITGAVQALVGSAAGGDQLTGSTALQSITATGADTFDGGGGSLTIADASPGASSTLSFQSDSIGSPQITVNLSTGQASGYGVISFAGSNIHNVIASAAGADTITVDASADDIVLGGANATINGPTGGPPNDTLSFALAAGGVTVDLTQGTFSGFGSGAVNGVFADLIGGPGGDILTGSSGVTYIYGGAGGGDVIADPFAGSAAAPATLIGGGGGANTLSLAADTLGGAMVTLPSTSGFFGPGGALPAGTGSVNAGAYGHDVLSNFQNLIGSALGGDTLVGSASALSIAAGPTMAGSLGDTFDGGGGGGGATESLTGAAGLSNTVTFAADVTPGAAGGVVVNLASGAVSGAYGAELLTNIHNVIGSASGADSITGDGTADVITLGAGADTVQTGAGAETIFAGAGGDLIRASAGLDVLSFARDLGGGLTASLSNTGALITGDGGADTVTGAALYGLVGSAAGADSLVGATSTHSLTAPVSAAGDTFDGGGGGTALAPETLSGGLGGGNVVTYAAETLSGAAGAVYVNLATGAETSANYGYESLANFSEVIGSAHGADTILANDAGDRIITGTGTVSIVSGAGNDTIDALAAAGGAITAAASRTSASAADLVEIGSAFFGVLSASNTTPAINPGAGQNTLAVTWQTSGASTSFDFASLTPNAAVVSGHSAVLNISTIDFSADTLASGGAAYAITAQEIENLTPNAVLNVKLPTHVSGGYQGGDSFQVQLTGAQSLVIGAQGTEYIYSSAVHTTLIATIHLI